MNPEETANIRLAAQKLIDRFGQSAGHEARRRSEELKEATKYAAQIRWQRIAEEVDIMLETSMGT